MGGTVFLEFSFTDVGGSSPEPHIARCLGLLSFPLWGPISLARSLAFRPMSSWVSLFRKCHPFSVNGTSLCCCPHSHATHVQTIVVFYLIPLMPNFLWFVWRPVSSKTECLIKHQIYIISFILRLNSNKVGSVFLKAKVLVWSYFNICSLFLCITTTLCQCKVLKLWPDLIFFFYVYQRNIVEECIVRFALISGKSVLDYLKKIMHHSSTVDQNISEA